MSNFDDFSWITGFMKSAAEGIPETIGITPSTDTLQFRQDHPISGIVSEFAGLAVPYAGWEAALLKAPKYIGGAKKLLDAVDKVGDVVNSPVSTGFKRTVLKWAPFEAARLGTSQVVGDNTFNQELASSVLNLALAGGVGGLVHGVAAAGLRDPGLPTIFPGLDIAAPAALQARHMKGLIDSGAIIPELLPKANLAFKTASTASRLEELGKNEKYVAEIQSDPTANPASKNMDQMLNRWFRPTAAPGGKALQVRAFAKGQDKNFGAGTNWIDEVDLAGVGGPRVPDELDPTVFHHPDPPWQYGQYFRSISFGLDKDLKVPKAVDNKFTKGMQNLGSNWFLTREADDGMFVMAKKYVGEPGKAEATDKWLMFKTDQPGRFVQDNQRWADTMVGLQKWIPEAVVDQDYGIAGNILKGFVKEVPFRNYQTLSKPGVMAKAIEKLGPSGQNEVGQRLKEAFREYFTPRIYQFSKVPRANYISSASKVLSDGAMNVVNELMNGVIKLDPGKQVFFGYLSNAQGPLGLPPIREIAGDLSQAEFANIFENFIRKGKPLEAAEAAYGKGDMTGAGLNFLKSLQAADEITTVNTNKAEKATGTKLTEWLKGHYGWSHVWEGDTRIPLHNEKGQLVHLAGGPNKKAAQAAADEALAANPGWKLGQAYSKSDVLAKTAAKATDVPEDVRLATLSPSFVLERAGVGGYKWHSQTPTVEDFLKDYENNLTSRWRYQANLASNDMLMPQLQRLSSENPAAYKQVMDRINSDYGIKGSWDRKINHATDQILAPMIGNESATKIVGITNTTMLNFHLGAMNLAYPATSLLTFIQTTLPEVAYVLSGHADSLSQYYSHFLAGGTRGPIGGMAVLQPLKLAGRALMAMIKPSEDVADAISWALNNRTLDPRMVEGYVGESTAKFKDIFKLAKGEIKPGDFPFGSWLKATSEWLPANSERLSRTHTFVMSYLAARDLLHKGGESLTRDQMLRFSQEFTNKTMYLYSAADKPKVLTSPVGTGLGLFKNWMFNYMASMGQYTQEGFLRNNWSPLLWQTAGTFALGGLSATPVYWAADMFSKAFTGNDALATSYDEFGDGADGIMYGLPALLTGVSFYSQVAAPGANPTRDATSMFDSVVWDRMRTVGTFMGSAMDHWRATGEHPGSDSKVRLQFAKAFMPSTIYRVMATGDGQVLSPNTGYPMVKDLSFYEQVLYKLKFNPVDIDKAMAVSNRLYDKREERKAHVAMLGEAFSHAQATGDSASMALIMRQAIAWGVGTSNVVRSAMIRTHNMRVDMVERGYKAQDRAIYQSVSDTY